ncbi:MAG TPA: tetratricopeptide repeat protein, partial [Kofleriaceae bacterium]|nr:tetratricopeptide repeat protein [Kofleriaceae bacterium]
MRTGSAIALLVALTAAAPGRVRAQPAPRPQPAQAAQPAPAQPDVGYIGREVTPLEIDDCRQTELGKAEVFKQGSEHYERGETLYVQGDYEGAVRELVYSYCLVPAFYRILKDIGQAYERNLDYEKAIGYLERYVKEVPPDAQRDNPCSPDPQQDKANVARRVEVLKKLRAKVYVESSPAGAQITIANDAGVAARARSGETIEVLGGHYEMTIELDGWKPHRQAIDVRIGKPYTYFVPLVAEQGRLSMQVVPPDARIFIGDRFVGIGHVDVELPGNTYLVTTEAPERITDRRQVLVLANQVKRVQVELTPLRQFGRRQLIAFATAGGAFATASLLYAFQDTGLAGLGSLAGAGAGFAGSVFLLPGDLALGTSNLTITSTLGASLLGAGVSLLFTKRPEVIYPVVGVSAALGGTVGYLIGDRTRINTGDAALINSGVVWGSAAGALFAVSFDPGHVVGGGLLLSGLGMGTVGGLLLQRNFSISRTHAALIDVGGLIGIIGGLAAESRIYPSDTVDARAQEHLANFALGGMAVGLLAAGVLTRDLDNPKIPVSPAITQATASDGKSVAVYGITAPW